MLTRHKLSPSLTGCTSRVWLRSVYLLRIFPAERSEVFCICIFILVFTVCVCVCVEPPLPLFQFFIPTGLYILYRYIVCFFPSELFFFSFSFFLGGAGGILHYFALYCFLSLPLALAGYTPYHSSLSNSQSAYMLSSVATHE